MQTTTADTVYAINEIFYSLQGEGGRFGEASIFIRFAGCNLTCSADDDVAGFDCDTEFTSHRKLTGAQIVDECMELSRKCAWVVLTGGEPTLQLDTALCELLSDHYSIAIETNGTKNLDHLDGYLDWICVSPKTAEHTIKVGSATEIKYVRRHGQGIPRPVIRTASYKWISPACQPDGSFKREDLEWCINLVKENPEWRLSMQQHKLWKVR